MNKLRRLFNPTPEDIAYHKKIFEKAAESKGCSTCSYCKHVVSYPGFVTAEECECTVGLECDTVLFSVKNCPKYERKEIDWDAF